MIFLQLIWAILSFAISCYALVVTIRLLRKFWQQRRDNLPTDQAVMKLLAVILLSEIV
jgi:uncharacterized protein YggT (Ycf19 family)